MTWASHIIVGASISKVFGLNYAITTFGSILPDLAEMVTKKAEHRGVTHSFALWTAALAIGWISGISMLRDCLIGVIFAHLFMDSLTVMGVPILDERSRRITLFGGRLRTASPGEFVLSGIIAFVAFAVLGSYNISSERRDWKSLYNQGVIDRREYHENRFKFF